MQMMIGDLIGTIKTIAEMCYETKTHEQVDVQLVYWQRANDCVLVET